MTPAERARQIDKQEFEAECRAIRERVFARLGIEQAEDRVHVVRAIAAPPAASKPFRVHGPTGHLHFVAGRSLTRRQWAAELGITYNAMNQAVHNYGSVEAVVIRRLGVSANG